MKKISLLSILMIFTSCEKESNSGCECKGKFGRVGQNGVFYAYNVDCGTGQPQIDIQGEGTYFMGCVD